MLNLLATTLCLLSGLSCRDEDLAGPRAARPEVGANSVVVSDSLCARVQFTITSAIAVHSTFPSRTTCTSGLVVIRGPAASWAQNPNRRLQLFVRLLNQSGQTVQLPVRLYLPANGTVVLAPAGTSASKVVALHADSSEAAGGRIWFVGGTGTLAANDSTVVDTLAFNVKAPVTQARFSFQATANTAAGQQVPAIAPDSVPTAVWQAIHAPSNMAQPTAQWGVPFPRNVLMLQFKGGSTQSERQTAVNAVGGVVIGGSRIGQDEGYYYVQIQDDGTSGPLFAAIAQLKALPQVRDVGPELPEIVPNYLRPNDGASWNLWKLDPDSADGENWAPEAIAAPQAWGCSSGDSAARIGVIDRDFRSLSEITANLDAASLPQFGQAQSSIAHGTKVASIIAARGNNGSGMTGVMWSARMNLQEYLTPNRGSTASVLDRLDALARSGVTVINISSSLYWQGMTPPRIPTNTAADSNVARRVFDQFKNKLDTLRTAGFRPLIVFGSSNDGIDAWWSGTGQLAAAFPDQVIVVAASTVLRTLAAFSDTGSLVSVAAPGALVGALDGSGTVALVNGTSFAAPQAAGLAGLLLSFDPRLQTNDLKQLILAGAVAGARSAGGVPILNAYESLKLAAERPGAPLCGNRVYAIADSVFVQRGSSGDEKILTLSTPGVSLSITSYHGGHDLGLNNYYGFTWANGHWDSVTPPFNPQASFSGAWNSVNALSHDRDSSAAAVQVSFNPNPVVEVRVTELSSSQTRSITTISGGFAVGGTVGGAVFPPLGRELIVPINLPAPPYGVWNVNAVDMITGATRVVYQDTNALPLYVGISEDGRELTAIAAGVSPYECRIEFRSIATGALLRPSITYPPPTNGCLGSGTTFAPIRGLSSLRP